MKYGRCLKVFRNFENQNFYFYIRTFWIRVELDTGQRSNPNLADKAKLYVEPDGQANDVGFFHQISFYKFGILVFLDISSEVFHAWKVKGYPYIFLMISLIIALKFGGIGCFLFSLYSIGVFYRYFSMKITLKSYWTVF